MPSMVYGHGVGRFFWGREYYSGQPRGLARLASRVRGEGKRHGQKAERPRCACAQRWRACLGPIGMKINIIRQTGYSSADAVRNT
eukprot:4048089-Pleurochrysis_carterae.AAC.5